MPAHSYNKQEAGEDRSCLIEAGIRVDNGAEDLFSPQLNPFRSLAMVREPQMPALPDEHQLQDCFYTESYYAVMVPGGGPDTQGARWETR